jgi:hypothetical protein
MNTLKEGEKIKKKLFNRYKQKKMQTCQENKTSSLKDIKGYFVSFSFGL